MSLMSEIEAQRNSINTYVNGLNDQMDDLINNLEDLTDPPLLDDRLDYKLPNSVPPALYTPISFTPIASRSASGSVPSFTLGIPVPPELNAIDNTIDSSVHLPNNVPNINTNFNVNDIIYNKPESIKITQPDLPDKYVLSDIPIPDITDINIPEAPIYTDLPVFSGTKPSIIDQAELPTLNYTEDEYLSGLKDSATLWLKNIILNGGTGLSKEVEAGIFDRSLTRETSTYRKNIESASDEFAASGFPSPTGALRARLNAIRSDYQIRVEDLNRKITEDQERLALDTSKFAVEQSIKLEAISLQHFNNVANRTLSFAQALVSTHQAVYNLKIAEYKAKWDGYKIEAEAYGELLRSSLVEVERFKAELEGTKLSSEIQKSKIDLYKSQVEGLTLYVNMYSSEMQAAKVQAEIEGLRLQAYKTEVEAAKIDIDAQVSQYESVKLNLAAQKNQIDIYTASIAGVNSANEAEKTKIEAQRANIQAQLAVNEKLVDSYRIAVDSHKASVQDYQANVEAYLGATKVNLAIAQADTESAKAVAQVNIENAKASSGVAIENSKIILERNKASAEYYNLQKRYEADTKLKTLAARITGATEGMSHLSTVAAAALSQLTSIAQAISSEDYSA